MTTIGEGIIAIRSDSSGFTSGLTSTLSSVGKVAAASFTVASAAAVGFGLSAFKAAARVGEMDATLRALSKGNTAVYETMQKTVSAIRSSGIEAGVAQGLVAQFSRNNLDLAKATDLSRIAQDAAVISGKNSTETLEQLVHGITTQNSLVLRNAGINVQAGQAMAGYAKELGKAQGDLTDSERAQAVLNAVIEAGIPIAGAYAAAMTEPGKVLRSFPRIFDDIKVAVGKPLVDAFGPTILAAYNFAKSLSASLQPGNALNLVVVAIGEKLAGAIAPFTKFIDKAADMVKAIKPAQLQGIVDVIAKIGPAAGSAGAGVFAMGAKSLPVIGGLLGSVNPLVIALGAFALTNKEVRDTLGGMMGELMELGKVLLSAISPAFSELMKVVAPLVPLLVDMAGSILLSLVRAFMPLVPLIVEVAKVIARLAEGALLWIVPIIGDLVDIAGDLVAVLGEALLGVIKDLEPVFRDLFDALGPIAATLIKDLEPAFKDIVKVMADLLPLVGPVVAVLARLATEALALLEPLLAPTAKGLLAVWAAFKIQGAVMSAKGTILGISGALKAMGAAAWGALGPWGLLAGAIIALGVGIYLAYKRFEPFRNVVDTVGRAIRDLAVGIFGFVTGSDDALKKLGPFKVAFEALLNPIRGVIDVIKGLVDIVTGVLAGDWSKVWGGMQKVAGGFLRAMYAVPAALLTNFGPAILKALTSVGSTIGEFFAGLGSTIWAALTGVANTVVEFFTGLPGLIVDALKALPGLLGKAMEFAIAAMIIATIGPLVGLYRLFTEVGPKAVRYLADLGPRLAAVALSAMAAMGRGLASGAQAVWDFFVTLPRRILSYVAGAGTWLVESGRALLGGLYTGAVNGVAAVWTFFAGMPGRIKSYFIGAIAWLVTAGKEVAAGLVRGVTEGVPALWSYLAGMPKRIQDAFMGAKDWLVDIGRKIIEGLIRGVGSMAGALGGAIGDVVTGGINKAKSVLGIGSPSKVFAAMGHDIGTGLIAGLEAMVPAVDDAFNDLVTPPDAPTLTAGPGSSRTGADQRSNYVLNIYPQTLDEMGVLAAFHRLEMIGAM